MKNLLLSNWHLMRIFRLGFSIFLFSQTYSSHQWFLIVFALFFLYQAVFNLGCGQNGCSLPYHKNSKNE